MGSPGGHTMPTGAVTRDGKPLPLPPSSVYTSQPAGVNPLGNVGQQTYNGIAHDPIPNTPFEQDKYGAETEKFKLGYVKTLAEIEKIKSSTVVDYANAGKLSQDADLNKTKTQLDAYDSLVDAQTKKIEVEGRLKVFLFRQ